MSTGGVELLEYVVAESNIELIYIGGEAEGEPYDSGDDQSWKFFR